MGRLYRVIVEKVEETGGSANDPDGWLIIAGIFFSHLLIAAAIITTIYLIQSKSLGILASTGCVLLCALFSFVVWKFRGYINKLVSMLILVAIDVCAFYIAGYKILIEPSINDFFAYLVFAVGVLVAIFIIYKIIKKDVDDWK